MNEEINPEETNENQDVVCPNCLERNNTCLSICANCGFSIGPGSNMTPDSVLHSHRFMYQNAIKGRPKFIVMLGIWIVFSGLLLISVTLLYTGIKDYFVTGDPVNLFGILIAMCFFVLGAVIPFKVTKNYFAKRGEEEGEIE